ncbi:MAG: PfkB family carbohydrate kinase [Planctomycetota bacterium]|nr:PfkB family carbohydrate kinase [Planctomycetota bacterium]
MPKSLLVVGSIALDTLRTPFGEAKDELGGAATFFSVVASFFVPVRLVGVVGEDFPKEFLRVFDSRRIDTAGLEVVPGGKTFRWHGSYQGAMNEAKTEYVALNVLGDFRPSIPKNFRDTRLVFLANGSPVTQNSVLDQIEKPDLVVADTMNLWIETQREALLALLARVDGIVLNEGEARMLTGEHNLIMAGRKVLALGPKFVVIKKGEHGSILVLHPTDPSNAALTHNVCPLPAYPATEVRDPTGAGDSFAGGMMGYLASAGQYGFQHLIRAMAYGTITASFAIEDFGLRRFERLSIDEIDRRLNEYHDMLTF